MVHNVVKSLHEWQTRRMATAPDLRPTRRERLREATLKDIVAAGRAQLRTTGPQGLTLSAVARELGMTAPALYRYVDGVDGLVTLLVSEGYLDLADRLEAARDAVPADDPGRRFGAVAHALRSWALDDPSQHGLLFGSPLPGYEAPEEGPTTTGARRAAGAMWSVLLEARAAGQLAPPLVTEVDPATLPLLEHKGGGELAAGLPPEVQTAGWAALSLLLGAVTVEVFGHMPACDERTCAALFEGNVAVARCIVGLPPPR